MWALHACNDAVSRVWASRGPAVSIKGHEGHELDVDTSSHKSSPASVPCAVRPWPSVERGESEDRGRGFECYTLVLVLIRPPISVSIVSDGLRKE